MDDQLATPREILLCETCLERGRERPATHEDLRMCGDCFSGKPFRRDETTGAGFTDQMRRARQRYRERNREKMRARQARYRQKNRAKIREKWREWKQRQRDKGEVKDGS